MKSLLVPLDASNSSGVQSSDRIHHSDPETKICRSNQIRPSQMRGGPYHQVERSKVQQAHCR